MHFKFLGTLLVFCCMAGGCSPLLLRTGKDVDHLFRPGVTRDEIRKKLGTPQASAVVDPMPGSTLLLWASSDVVVGWEEYHYRGYVEQPGMVEISGMGVAMTFGFAELLFHRTIAYVYHESRVRHCWQVYYTPQATFGCVSYRRSDQPSELTCSGFK